MEKRDAAEKKSLMHCTAARAGAVGRRGFWCCRSKKPAVFELVWPQAGNAGLGLGSCCCLPGCPRCWRVVMG